MDLICGGILVLIVLGGLLAAITRKTRVANANAETMRLKYPEEYARRRGLDFQETPFARGWTGAGMDFVEKNRGWSYKFVADTAEELNRMTRLFNEGLPDVVDNPPIKKQKVDELFDEVTPRGQLRA